jgi:2-keto-myo-inositol isomerase
MKPDNFIFKTGLNTSTLIPFNLDIAEQVEVCRRAGYDGIELWLRDIDSYVKSGGDLDDIRKQTQDWGLSVFNGIAFIKYADRDPAVRRADLEKAKKEMDILKKIGCSAMAAPPFGDTEGVSTEEYTEYFGELYKIGMEIGVEPYLELWGHRGNIRTIKKAWTILEKGDVENGKMLLDPIHIYKGGGDFRDIAGLSSAAIGTVHVNDFPLSMGRTELADTDRCFPGDGEADLNLFKEMISETGYRGFLSLELFVQDYGLKTAADVASYGLESIYKIFSGRA